MAGRECGFCTREFAEGEPFVNVRVLVLDELGQELLQEEVLDACKECAARTHIVRESVVEKHDRR